MNKTEKSAEDVADIADKTASVWRVLTAYTQLYGRSGTPPPPWDPVAHNRRESFRTLLRCIEWRCVLTPFSIAMIGYNTQYEEPGLFENVQGREAYIFGIRVARWIVKREWRRDDRYKQALAGQPIED
jgi:hypothetical protein